MLRYDHNLRGWKDLLGARIKAADVQLSGYGAGTAAALDYRLALTGSEIENAFVLPERVGTKLRQAWKQKATERTLLTAPLPTRLLLFGALLQFLGPLFYQLSDRVGSMIRRRGGRF